MKTLGLVRHAKSSWADPSLPDFDRPLNSRGQRDLPRMAAWLAAQQLAWDAALVSASRRTRDTLVGLQEYLTIPTNCIHILDALYLAAVPTLLEHIQHLPDSTSSALLINHNPSISELRNQLLDVSEAELPTCAMVGIQFHVQRWADVQPGSGRLLYEMWPKRL